MKECGSRVVIFVLVILAVIATDDFGATAWALSLPSAARRTAPSVASLSSNSPSTQKKNQESSYNDEPITMASLRSRRQALFGVGATVLATTTAATVFCTAQPANAASSNNSELFRPNPLTNPVLEKIRIWEQAEADEMKYGGELERGDAGSKAQGGEGYFSRLLIPILEIDNNLGRVEKLILESSPNDKESWKASRDILSQSMFQTIEFKKIFNAYGDNIYYSNPDRANLYLGGGATPRPEQSVAYLLRNEILTKVQDLQAELDYLLKQSSVDPDDTQEVVSLVKQTRAAMAKYLDLLPPEEVEQARSALLKEAASS